MKADIIKLLLQSHADGDDAVRTMALDDRARIGANDVRSALDELKRHELPVRS